MSDPAAPSLLPDMAPAGAPGQARAGVRGPRPPRQGGPDPRQGDLFGSASGPAAAQAGRAADAAPAAPELRPEEAAVARDGDAPARASRRTRARGRAQDGAAVVAASQDAPPDGPVAAATGPAAVTSAPATGAHEPDAAMPEMPGPSLIAPDAAVPDADADVAEPAVPEAGVPAPALLRADPLAFRPKDRPDGWLYHVTTGEAADPLLRHGLSPDAAPPLLERSAVAARLASLAEELGPEAEHPGALAVLRLRRHAVLDRLRAVPGGGWVLTEAAPSREARR